ncbi:DUF2218 domain-containing protein [Alkalimarinus coralli]|uniref:DUF2218 domain-containing protein n=1 Tax=Alkalimarinus coralli TaxID=2935863 RepID=UPI00202B9FFF|nr:DUF2218 domain-containing protein [Alkalimarinus coralli]
MTADDKVKPFSLISAMTSEQKESNEFELADAETGLGENVREAIINTPKASMYLQKMCRHFTHRVPAHWNAQRGKVFFDMGWCFMTATEQELKVRCEAHSEAELEEILETLKRHFDRFALKDQLVLSWL